MKKLLIIPIMIMYYLLIAVLFPIEIILICVRCAAEFIVDFTNKVINSYDTYLMEPFSRIHFYYKE